MVDFILRYKRYFTNGQSPISTASLFFGGEAVFVLGAGVPCGWDFGYFGVPMTLVLPTPSLLEAQEGG